MEAYYFNDELFKKLSIAIETTTKTIAAEIGTSDNTIRIWRRSKDVPLDAIISICNSLRIPIGHFICTKKEETNLMLGRRHYVLKEEEFKEIHFLNKEFGEEVTAMQERLVMEFCELAGIGPSTFYKNFRNVDTVSKSLGISCWLNMCNKTKTYPMDFLLCDCGPKVPVLNGFRRRSEGTLELLTKRNTDILSHNTRLAREMNLKNNLIKELREEIKRLKKELEMSGDKQ